MFGLRNVWGDTAAHGKTDPLIICEIGERALSRPLTEPELQQLLALYARFFAEEIQNATRFRTLPGAQEICRALSKRQDCILGIQTGNLESTAKLKLKRAELEGFFRFGGYASDAPQRREFVQIAIARAHTVASGELRSVVVIGDSLSDVDAGKAAGATTIGVCTGRTTAKEFADAGADHVFSDLRNTDQLLALLGKL